MIEAFLRPPQGAVAFAADAARVLGALAVVVAFIWFEPTDAGIAALALPALVLPRFLAVPAAFDLLFCVTVLVAAWSNIVDLYTTVPGWDLVVHLVCTGVIGVMLVLLLGRSRVIPLPERPSWATALVLTVGMALAAAALWEMVEWFGHAVIDPSIHVNYDDTITDMAAGGVGGALGGIALKVLTARAQRPAASSTR